MINIIWVVLIVFLAILQLSKARPTATPLQGRPFDGRTVPAKQPQRAIKDPSPTAKPRVVPELVEKEVSRTSRTFSDSPQLKPVEATSARPSLQNAVIWSEILNKPVSIRNKRI